MPDVEVSPVVKIKGAVPDPVEEDVEFDPVVTIKGAVQDPEEYEVGV